MLPTQSQLWKVLTNPRRLFLIAGPCVIESEALCREVAERFNRKFGPVFPMATRIKGEAPRILGLDGNQKMSKSLDNYIGVLDEKDRIISRLKPAFTDPARLRRDDPGHPEVCNIYSLHKLFSDGATCARIDEECRRGTIGCFDCKNQLATAIDTHLAPIRERADHLRAHPSIVLEALATGRDRAGQLAGETMREVRDAMGIGPQALNRL